MVKGDNFFFSEKRWLKKSIMGMKVWIWYGIVCKCAWWIHLTLQRIVAFYADFCKHVYI